MNNSIIQEHEAQIVQAYHVQFQTDLNAVYFLFLFFIFSTLTNLIDQ